VKFQTKGLNGLGFAGLQATQFGQPKGTCDSQAQNHCVVNEFWVKSRKDQTKNEVVEHGSRLPALKAESGRHPKVPTTFWLIA